MDTNTTLRFSFSAALGMFIGFSVCQASTINLVTPQEGLPDDVPEGMRFLGNYDDYKVYRVHTGAKDQEPMYAAVRIGSKQIAAFFRAGAAQCWTKVGGIVPCDFPKEANLASFGDPLVPWTPDFPDPTNPIDPNKPTDPTDPIYPTDPQPSPVPLPYGWVLMLTVMFAFAFKCIFSFCGEYEELRSKCCGNPEKEGT